MNQPARTRIKVCGVTTVEAARSAVEAGADAIGLVFAPASPRRVSFDQAVAIVAALPPFVSAVGVFQLGRETQMDFERWKGLSPLSQLHGNEDEAMAKVASRGRRIIKGFRFSPSEVKRWNHCTHVDMLLVDGPGAGSGRPFDHRALAEMMRSISKPVILAGGLTQDNVANAIRMVRPFAVDVSSGVESAPGVKDDSRIDAFCRAVREADRQPA